MAEDDKAGLDTSVFSFLKKSKAVLAVEKSCWEDNFRTAERVFSEIHSI